MLFRSSKLPVAWIQRRIREVAKVCHEGCEVLLPNAKATTHGRILLDEITALDERFMPYVDQEE